MGPVCQPVARSLVSVDLVVPAEDRLHGQVSRPLRGRLPSATRRPTAPRPGALVSVRRRLKRAKRLLRETRMVAMAILSPDRPIVAQIIVTRRCNLACAYCNEYDRRSDPVPTASLLRRIDRMAELGTAVITLSGGEPLLHPDLDRIVARIRKRGAMAAVLTNGTLLTEERVRRLNRAGLDYLQISIDNRAPDAVSKKSLSVLDHRLVWLASLAEFQVTINSVVGVGIDNPEDAVEIARRARGLGFTSTVGVVHDNKGQVQPLDEAHRNAIDRILRLNTSLFSFAQCDQFQENLSLGRANHWHCRAGGRFVYVCEDGLVHRCSQQRGTPGIPLERCSAADLVREANRPKPCAPFCTVSCVHRVAVLDSIRERPAETLTAMLDRQKKRTPGFEASWLVKLLFWLFLNPGHACLWAGLTRRMFGVTHRTP